MHLLVMVISLGDGRPTFGRAIIGCHPRALEIRSVENDFRVELGEAAAWLGRNFMSRVVTPRSHSSWHVIDGCPSAVHSFL